MYVAGSFSSPGREASPPRGGILPPERTKGADVEQCQVEPYSILRRVTSLSGMLYGIETEEPTHEEKNCSGASFFPAPWLGLSVLRPIARSCSIAVDFLLLPRSAAPHDTYQ